MEQELLLGVPELWPAKYLRGGKKKCCTINLFEQVKSKVMEEKSMEVLVLVIMR